MWSLCGLKKRNEVINNEKVKVPFSCLEQADVCYATNAVKSREINRNGTAGANDQQRAFPLWSPRVAGIDKGVGK